MSLKGIVKKVTVGNVSAGTVNAEAREEWLRKTLLALPAGGRILDAGAGERPFRKYCAHLKYVSQDFSEYDGRGDGIGLQMGSWDQDDLDIVGDITSIPEPDKSFDAVMCTEVFEHIPDPPAAIREFSRLLRSGGELIITAPFCSITHFAPYHYSTGFSSYYYEKHLAEKGFEILEMTANGNYFEYVAQEIRRIPEVVREYSTGWGRRRAAAYRLASLTLLTLLTRASAANRSSEKLLCFGFHVRARKI